MPLSRIPNYNLKAVLAETGVPADTLRAWERRYGLPKPQRTAGGHRLYSQHDIHLIRWLVARQAEGLSISRAVKRWNELSASGDDPLAEPMAAQRNLPETRANLATTRGDWLKASLDFNESAAEEVLGQAFAMHPVETVLTEVILRGLRQVGSGWQKGGISVQQEHFVSGLAMRRFDALSAAAPVPARSPTVVLACPPGELHSLPLLYLNVMLRRRGRNVVFLGADVPLEHLEDTTRMVKATLVVLGAQRLTTARGLRDTAALLARRCIPMGYGGGIFNRTPEIRNQIAGEFLGEEVEQAVERIDELLASTGPAKEACEPKPDPVARAFRRSRPAIDAALQRQLDNEADIAADLTIASSYFGNALDAALELGEAAYLAADMDWMRVLLTRPRLPFPTTRAYVLAYSAAVREVMGTSGAALADWLERYAVGA